MAIEVLRAGKKPENKKYTAECIGCNTRVRFLRSDARFVADQRDGDSLVINCPVCERDIWAAV